MTLECTLLELCFPLCISTSRLLVPEPVLKLGPSSHPSPVLTEQLQNQILRDIFAPLWPGTEAVGLAENGKGVDLTSAWVRSAAGCWSLHEKALIVVDLSW
jgi:hypothetical protein